MMYDILLIQPKTIFSKRLDIENSTATHLLLLGTVLKQEGFTFKIIDLLLENDIPSSPVDLKELASYYKSLVHYFSQFNNVPFVGISCYTSNFYLSTVVTAWAIRQAIPRATIIVGGYGVNTCPQDFIYENSPFDYIFIGEADLKFAEFIKQIRNGIGKDRNPGKDGTARVIECPEIEDINDLPLIDWTLLEDTCYLKSTMVSIPYYASRGCPFHCKYCCDLSSLEQLSYHKQWRPKQVDKIHQELYNLNEFLGKRPSFIFFSDPIFGLKRDWKREMLATLTHLSRDWKNRFFWIEERVDTIMEEDIKQFKQLSLTLTLGLENGSPAILRLMNKTKNPVQYLKKMAVNRDMLEDYRIYYAVNIMFGFPGETEKEFRETETYVKDLFRNTKYGFPIIAKYNFFPGSYVFKNHSQPEFSGMKVWLPDWYKRICNFAHILPLVDPSSTFNFIDVIQNIVRWAGPFYTDLLSHFSLVPEQKSIYFHLKHLHIEQLAATWSGRFRDFEKISKRILENKPELMPVDKEFITFIEKAEE
ncbi:MAG: B12-binding domain-containing radical SAM protein [Spirochaetales bacterium]|nr:B12-binding domain-containing radical SAM protein [Spirochaetales bacterium]